MKNDPEQLAKICKALADANRIRILSLLLQFGFCVNAVAERLSMSKSSVSQHLKILREAGLVKGEKRGYFTHYEVNRNQLKLISGALGDLSRVGSSQITKLDCGQLQQLKEE